MAHHGAKRRYADLAQYESVLPVLRAQNDALFLETLRALHAELRASEKRGDRLGMSAALGRLGTAELELADYDNALHHLRSALEISERDGDERAVTGALLDLGRARLLRDEFVAARDAFDRAVVLAARSGNRASAVLASRGIAECLAARGLCGEALALADNALAVHRAAGDDPSSADCLILMGRITLMQGAPSVALDYLREGLSLAEAGGMRRPAAFAARVLAEAYSFLGQYCPAEENCRRSIEMFRRAGDSRNAAAGVISLSGVQSWAGLVEEARLLVQEAASLAELRNFASIRGAALQADSRLKIIGGDFEGAFLSAETSAEIFGTLEMAPDQAASCLAGAEALLRAGRLDDARQWLDRAGEAARGLELMPLACRMEHLSGLMECSRTESLESGVEHLESALAAAQVMRWPEAAWKAALDLHGAHVKLGNLERAAQFLDSARETFRSVAVGLPVHVRPAYDSRPDAAGLSCTPGTGQ